MDTSIAGETLNEDIIALEKLRWVDTLRPRSTKSGAETWSVAYSPDNSYFAWSCGHCIVVILPWDLLNNRPCDFDDSLFLNALHSPEARLRRDFRRPLIVNCDSHVRSLAFGVSSNFSDKYSNPVNGDGSPRRPFHNLHSPDNKLILAVGLNNGRIRVYSVYSGKFLLELMDHKDIVKDLKFSPAHSLVLLSASADSTLKLWNLNDDGNMFKTLIENSSILCCDWSPDGRFVAAGGKQKLLIIFETDEWTTCRALIGHNNSVSSCEFSTEGSFLASSSYDTTVIVWNFITGDRLLTFWHLLPPPRLIFAAGANEHYVRCLALSPDAQHVATICDDNYLRIWNIFKPKHPRRIAQVTNPACVRYSADGFSLCVGTKEGNLHLFASPMVVQSLAQLSRLAIRRKLPANQVRSLPLPQNLKNFLLYR